ncbi:SMP-30/gluconolactonase/LRE family protein [Aestuariivirga sp.]|uniref:SMP-30/gluconolactonase/LRE family protein n=1 Tax=Aestuariivirga sp. TaxID=2650926 RepID=UPI00391DAA0A
MGTYAPTETELRAILYCVKPDGSRRVTAPGFASCSGPAFSPDGLTMYFSDSAGLAYEVAPECPRISNHRLSCRVRTEGRPARRSTRAM